MIRTWTEKENSWEVLDYWTVVDNVKLGPKFCVMVFFFPPGRDTWISNSPCQSFTFTPSCGFWQLSFHLRLTQFTLLRWWKKSTRIIKCKPITFGSGNPQAAIAGSWGNVHIAGEALLPPCLHCCNIVISAIAGRQESWVRWCKMICSLTQCGPLFWVVYSSHFPYVLTDE